MTKKEIIKIIKEFKQENYNSFDLFYNETSRGVYIYVFNVLKNREKTEEVLHQTYMRFIFSIDRCSKNKHYLSYLLSVAEGVLVDLYNKEKESINSKDVVNNIKVDINKEDVFYILDYLNQTEKQIVMLYQINKMSFHEISDFLDMSVVKVRRTYHIAIKHLKKEVGE